MITKISPKIIAHRGAPLRAPENTLSSFQIAKDLGATSIELDVHMSADGALIVHHDYSVGGKEIGTGLIMHKTLEEIKRIDAGSWFSTKFIGERIPTLNEVFQEFSDSLDYEIELKGATPHFLESVIALAKEHSLLKRIEFTSPHTVLLCLLKQRYPKVKCGAFFSMYPDWMSKELGERLLIDTLLLIPANVAHVPLSLITNRLVENIHKAGTRIHIADCNTLEDIRQAVNWECDQFSTDNIEIAVSL